MARQTPEGKVKDAIKKYLKSIGAWYYLPSASTYGFGRTGCPDILVCHQGRFWAFEAKAPGKRGNTTPNQKMEIAAINASGGRAVVVDDVQQVIDLMEGGNA